MTPPLPLDNVVGSKRLQSERDFVLFAKFNVSEFGEFNKEPFFLSGSPFCKMNCQRAQIDIWR